VPDAPTGPLNGLKVIELAGIGPGPFCGMMLADLGADVLRIDRAAGAIGPARLGLDVTKDILARGRRSLKVDLKNPQAAEFVLALVEKADVLFEGNRPGVTERLGIGPEVCLARNPRLVYGRMTGFGQTGPMSRRAGHDINYIALSGALATIGRAGEKPVPPSNYVGDLAGGGLMLALGILAAVLHARSTGTGQVIDAAMVEGAAVVTAFHHMLLAMGAIKEERGANIGDTGAPYYEVYETADGRYMAVGANEPQFYASFLTGLGLDPARFAEQTDPRHWADYKREIEAAFKSKTQDEWVAVYEGVDCCVTPVLWPSEAPDHPHNRERGAFVRVDGVLQPAPAPRFSGTPTSVRPVATPGQYGDEALAEWGIDPELVKSARAGERPCLRGNVHDRA